MIQTAHKDLHSVIWRAFQVVAISPEQDFTILLKVKGSERGTSPQEGEVETCMTSMMAMWLECTCLELVAARKVVAIFVAHSKHVIH